MSSPKRGDRVFRTCRSTQTTVDRNPRGCACSCSNKLYEKSTGMVCTPAGNEAIRFKPAPASKKTCTRCHSRRESTLYELEPYEKSSIQFYETSTPSLPSRSSGLDVLPNAKLQTARKSSNNVGDLTPKEIMNTWMPGRGRRPTERLFTPSDNYVDVSPRDFSMRKYFPELLLSESEKKEMRDDFIDNKRPERSKDWGNIVDDLAVDVIRTPCPWREDMALAREREEAAEEESNAKLQTPQRRRSKWFKWPCSGSKRGKKKRDKRKGSTDDEP